MLIESYRLEVFTPPCSPGDERFSAIADLPADIREALPFLNGTLHNAAYSRAAHALSWRKGSHYVVFHPKRIAISNVVDRQAAIDELDGLVQLVNRTWEQRAGIAPNYEEQARPTAMALFKLLPATNCRQCGQPTCWNFALRLATSQATPDQCPPLAEPTFAGRLVQLRELLGLPATTDAS
jgi:ArsR family metal-binding transcriptional regulator